MRGWSWFCFYFLILISRKVIYSFYEILWKISFSNDLYTAHIYMKCVSLFLHWSPIRCFSIVIMHHCIFRGVILPRENQKHVMSETNCYTCRSKIKLITSRFKTKLTIVGYHLSAETSRFTFSIVQWG